ncbi:MAG: hypothetical protein IJR87_04200, partial [Bacteroidaceae bacterium]|nr:hypothetical protein [Bacteroidaceae bacterium]
WVEPSGDMVFYISRTDAWSETGELYKLGRIRVSTKPAITSANDFCQTLDLENGRINLRGAGMDLNFFIDSDSPTIYLTGSSSSPFEASVKAEVWRTKEESANWMRSIGGCPDQQLFRVFPDYILQEKDAIMLYHHNSQSSYDTTLDIQGIQIDNRASYDPFKDRCFGYRIEGTGMKKVSDQELRTSAPTTKIDIHIPTFSGIFHNATKRVDEMRLLTASTAPAEEAMERTADFWNAFWNRSYIYVDTPDDDLTFRINSSYILQRWIQACAGRGNYPIKFNGSLFTVDPQLTSPSAPSTPDFRTWGGDYWWQNTRLPYHPMLKSGDYDMMKPLFEHYFRNLPMMKANARALTGVDGALSPETATVFGTYSYSDYQIHGEPCEKLANNLYIRYHWDSSVEMISLMLDYYDYTQDAEFVSSRLVPYAREMLKFYKNFYGVDDKGKLLISPTQSLETYWYDVINDMPTVVGLRDVIPRLMALPEELSTEEDKSLWKQMSEIMPELPLMTLNGKTQFASAEHYKDQRTNVENPRLYPIFPFHLCNISTDNLQIGIDSYWDRESKDEFGWSQDGQEAARLGLTYEAVRLLDVHTLNSNPNFRFKAIWGPNYDWTPDQDHGSTLLMILQDMVLQTWNGKDYLLPAFPKSCWGVKYKLHSHAGQVVEGEYNWKKTPKHHFVDGFCTECGQPDPALVPVVDGWYEVSTPAQLRYISNLVNNGKYDIKVRLTADIDLSGISYFPPIGKQYWPQGPALYFSGTFDGQGHIIYNLSIDKDDAGAETGLFGRLNGATVKNLGIVNAIFKNSSALRAGVLGGCANNSHITNCFTAGDIVMENCICSFNHKNGSGLFGLITSGSEVSNCYTNYATLHHEPDSRESTIMNCYWGDEANAWAPTGELCYKLNGDQSTITWYQKMGEDAYPVLDANRGTVIKNEDGSYGNITGIE